ncbi:uncharacterized protein AlacWU_11216 [Aspergillus niger]|nr:uncharacterized protein AlacWU_11216 [Aspergillus niger]
MFSDLTLRGRVETVMEFTGRACVSSDGRYGLLARLIAEMHSVQWPTEVPNPPAARLHSASAKQRKEQLPCCEVRQERCSVTCEAAMALATGVGLDDRRRPSSGVGAMVPRQAHEGFLGQAGEGMGQGTPITVDTRVCYPLLRMCAGYLLQIVASTPALTFRNSEIVIRSDDRTSHHRPWDVKKMRQPGGTTLSLGDRILQTKTLCYMTHRRPYFQTTTSSEAKAGIDSGKGKGHLTARALLSRSARRGRSCRIQNDGVQCVVGAGLGVGISLRLFQADNAKFRTNNPKRNMQRILPVSSIPSLRLIRPCISKWDTYDPVFHS